MEARASAIVYSVAELEALTRFTLQRTHEELNAGKHKLRDIRSCLRQLAAHSTFESLRELNDAAKLWARRAEATTLEESDEILSLPIVLKRPQPPLDGRTLRPEHFLRIWDIYGLPDSAFPTIGWAASIQKLAGVRNDLAHGNVPFTEVFKTAGMRTDQIERYLEDVYDFTLHFATTWVEYLNTRQYLASP
jgi:hypothetical protein